MLWDVCSGGGCGGGAWESVMVCDDDDSEWRWAVGVDGEGGR